MATQREHWDTEHRTVAIHPAMNDSKPSGAVLWMLQELAKRELDLAELTGLEMGCGKGRNAMYLAEKGVTMSAFDFSEVAIAESKKRAEEGDLAVDWKIADAGKKWPFPSETFDIGIDCYASTDIDTPVTRTFARDEWKRVMRPGGTLLVAAISDQSPFHAEMIAKHPGSEIGSFLHASGTFEKTFAEEELWEFYEDFELLASTISRGKATIAGKERATENIWLLLGI